MLKCSHFLRLRLRDLLVPTPLAHDLWILLNGANPPLSVHAGSLRDLLLDKVAVGHLLLVLVGQRGSGAMLQEPVYSRAGATSLSSPVPPRLPPSPSSLLFSYSFNMDELGGQVLDLHRV